MIENEKSDGQGVVLTADDLGTAVRMVSQVPISDEFKMKGDGWNEKQGLLFNDSAFVLPEAVRRYTKAVSVIHAVPETAMNVNQKRLMDGCILVAQLYFRKLSADVIGKMREMRAAPMFEVRTQYLRKLSGISENGLEPLLKNFEVLRSTGFRWNVIGEDNKVEFGMKSSFVTTYGFGEGKATGWTRFALEPAVLELILDPSMYASFSIQVMGELGTESSYSLYQAVYRYVNTNQKQTPLLPVETWIELIKGPCRYIVEDEKTGVKRVRELADFKRRDLIPAMTRVNGIDALNYEIKLIERKSGPKIVGWRFEFIQKIQRQITYDIPKSWPIEMEPLLLSMGFNAQEISDMAQGYSVNEIAEALRNVEKAEISKKAKGERIHSHKHYLRQCLETLGAKGKELSSRIDEIEAIARKKAEEEASANREKSAKLGFSDHQCKVLSASIEAMSEIPKRELLDAFMEYVKTLSSTEQYMLEKDADMVKKPSLLIMRKWLKETRPDQFSELLPYPQDRSMDSWLLWKMEKEIKQL